MLSKKFVYIPHTEYRLLSAMYDLLCNGIYYCLYTEYFSSIEKHYKDKHNEVWFVLTINAYYDLAIINWCKIFGSHTEPTHYFQLISSQNLQEKLKEMHINPSDSQQLKARLLANANLSLEELNNYHPSTKDYRDRNLIHREHSPTKINDGDLSYPKLKIAKKTFISLLVILIILIKKFPTQEDKINAYKFTYDDVDTQDKIIALIKKSFPNLV